VAPPELDGHSLLGHGPLVWLCFMPIVYSDSQIPPSKEDLFTDADHVVEAFAT
jgi:hypothetical protein